VMWGDYWMLSQFDSVVVGLNVLTGPDPDASTFFLSSASPAKGGAGQNTWVYENPEVDALLTQGAETVVPEERREAYLKIQEILRADLPFLPIYQYAVIHGRKAGVEGFAGNVNNRIDTWNVRSWRWN
jgi:peptide/nickel transport system substrate-binding protein